MPLVGTTTTLAPTNATDAEFRAWGKGISDKLAAAGLIQTADTGQIDWTTVLKPTLTGTAQGYEIWRFDDGLQATAPVFFKIEYGSSPTAVNNVGIWITFGTGSNGSGTITGNPSARIVITTTGASANLQTCYWCGGDNRFVAALFCAGTGAGTDKQVLLSFERSVDAAGVPTGDAVLIAFKNGQTSGVIVQHFAWSPATGTLTATEASLGTVMPAAGTGTTGADVALYPDFHQHGLFFNPGKNFLAYFHGAITQGVPFNFTFYGASLRYMPVGEFVAGTSAGSALWKAISARLDTAASQPSVAVRYDA